MPSFHFHGICQRLVPLFLLLGCAENPSLLQMPQSGASSPTAGMVAGRTAQSRAVGGGVVSQAGTRVLTLGGLPTSGRAGDEVGLGGDVDGGETHMHAGHSAGGNGQTDAGGMTATFGGRSMETSGHSTEMELRPGGMAISGGASNADTMEFGGNSQVNAGAMTAGLSADFGGAAGRGGTPSSGGVSVGDAAGQAIALGGAEGAGDLPPCMTGFGVRPILRNMPYADTDERQRLDLYLTDAPGPNPLLVWIHGGGWRQGDKTEPPFLWFRQRGYSIAAIEYRYSDSGYPAPMLDVKAAIRWLKANAQQYALDPQRFAAIGASAGGHLASILGATDNLDIFDDPNLGHADVSSEVQAVVNLYGPVDLPNMPADWMIAMCPVREDCPGCPKTNVTQLLGCTVEQCPQKAIQASPISHVHPSMPPHLTFHGTADCSVPPNQSRRFHDSLLAQNVDSTLVTVDGAGHARHEVLNSENLLVLVEFLETTLRACQPEAVDAPGPEEDRRVQPCLHEACADAAQSCESDDQCVELDACFYRCLSSGRLDCVSFCLTDADVVFNDPAYQNIHRPLYECGRNAGCYPTRQLDDCLHNGCAQLARACEQNTDCVRLDTCFQSCFGDGEQGCIQRCLGETGLTLEDEMVSDIHRPLFVCGRPLGCYEQDVVDEGCDVQWNDGEVIRNLSYADVSPRQILDLYLTTAPGPNPLLIWIHGGGWRGGNHRAVPNVLLGLRERGYSIASIEYRLSDIPWPATMVDVKAAVRWLRAHAVEYAFDPNRFVAVGTSAGGHLASMLGTSIGVDRFDDMVLGYPEISSAVQTVVNFYGPTDILQMDADAADCPPGALTHDAVDSPEGLLLDCQPSACPERAAEASPITYVDGNEPPFLTFHGRQDCTVPAPQGRRLHDALIAQGRVSNLRIVDGAGHSLNECLAGGNYELMVDFIDEQMDVCQPD